MEEKYYIQVFVRTAKRSIACSSTPSTSPLLAAGLADSFNMTPLWHPII